MKKLLLGALFLFVQEAQASQGSLGSAIPFIGVLLSLSLFPLLLPAIWYRFEKIVLILWSLASLGILVSQQGLNEMNFYVLKVVINEYIPFIVMVSTLYVMSASIHIRIEALGTPKNNVVFLSIGSLLASVLGTTGASILLLRPFLHMNRNRQNRTHQIIFFIFIIGNIAGVLTPLGDAPLFLAYLNGVDFFWPLKNLSIPFLAVLIPLLLIYIGIDSYLFRKELPVLNLERKEKFFRIEGGAHIALLLTFIILIVMTGMDFFSRTFSLKGQLLSLGQLIRDGGGCALCLVSYALSYKAGTVRHSWGPLLEIVYVFAAIFLTLIPVNLLLQRGGEELAPLFALTKSIHAPFFYFWLSGIFSAFLDNAPTYLIFFEMAGGEAATLMGPQAKTLIGISLGSVFMGALTYIGNTPNFMIRSIAKQNGVSMPGFLGYMGWAFLFLIPLFWGVSRWVLW